MRPGLSVGMTGAHSHVVAVSETVRHLFADAPAINAMPEVFATAYMVGLMEWGCVELIAPFYEAGEGSVGVHVDVSHTAATPPGMTVTVSSRITAIDGKFIWFDVSAHDGVDEIGRGRHQRAVVNFDRFAPKVAAKLHVLAREQG
jgi:fluoroacetyl-CoA thioesterase